MMTLHAAQLAAPLAWSLQWPELVMIMFIALLIFGKRLPEVARSLGRGINEFKAGLRDIGDQVDLGDQPQTTRPLGDQRPVTPLPPPQEPVARTAAPAQPAPAAAPQPQTDTPPQQPQPQAPSDPPATPSATA